MQATRGCIDPDAVNYDPDAVEGKDWARAIYPGRYACQQLLCPKASHKVKALTVMLEDINICNYFWGA